MSLECLRNIEISHCDIEFGSPLGHGQFGAVKEGLLSNNAMSKLSLSPTDNGRVKVAVKMLTSSNDDNIEDKFLLEAVTMRQFKHPNIIELLAVCSRKSPLCLIMEIARHGELRDFLAKHSNELILSDLLCFMRQLCSALEYLAARSYVHRDVAARNVLVFDWRRVKLADFGLSRWLETEDCYTASKGKLPIKWMAPESISHYKFTTMSDAWSFGVCCWEILSYGIKPFVGVKNSEILSRLESGQRLLLPTDCPEQLFDIVAKCWELEPDKRSTFAQISEQLKEFSKRHNYTSNQGVPLFASGGVEHRAFLSEQQMLAELESKMLRRRLEETKRQSREDSEWLKQQDALRSEALLEKSQESDSACSSKDSSEPFSELTDADKHKLLDKLKGLATDIVGGVVALNSSVDAEPVEELVRRVLRIGLNIREYCIVCNSNIDKLFLHNQRQKVSLSVRNLQSDYVSLGDACRLLQRFHLTNLRSEYINTMLQAAHVVAVDCKGLLDALVASVNC